MSLAGPKLINKQFNSPIKLYSPQSIQETMDHQNQAFSNVGINYGQLAKPKNLQNSAVLKMLEEEEEARQRGVPYTKRVVAWPPPPEDQDLDEYIEQGPITAKNQKGRSSNHTEIDFEAPPSLITLRPEAPITQSPSPIYQAQPATAKSLLFSDSMRGDLKWPPPECKRKVEEENRARLELAKGPSFRPRRVHKDYTPFFAQHALTFSYPPYRPPPGTQYYNQEESCSSMTHQ